MYHSIISQYDNLTKDTMVSLILIYLQKVHNEVYYIVLNVTGLVNKFDSFKILVKYIGSITHSSLSL